jgi:IS5 family transposase
MGHRTVGQISWVEALLPEGVGSNRRLQRIAGQVDWQPVARCLNWLRRAKTGRPAWPPLLLVKALLLQQWYRLSDRDSRRRSPTG